ncbi:hypothetical protein [Nocardioides sp. B-3]|uniref:hypothetical protein n=1 Tax=Nocardioides sp. B-3 TaxID=2895565 RepID=UPI0021524162|nr:hypothetical protein [Nocardioides sp. B-3]UUZ60218.1 hypothetical protein LP418_04570 [Nocardioides sp. B-3]
MGPAFGVRRIEAVGEDRAGGSDGRGAGDGHGGHLEGGHGGRRRGEGEEERKHFFEPGGHGSLGGRGRVGGHHD